MNLKPYERREADSRVLVCILIAVGFLAVSCSPQIARFDERSFEYAITLKIETLALMEKAGEPYRDHEEEIDALRLRLRIASEYVNLLERNIDSGILWHELIRDDGSLLGEFFTLWTVTDTLSSGYREESMDNIRDQFNDIIELEKSKLR